MFEIVLFYGRFFYTQPRQLLSVQCSGKDFSDKTEVYWSENANGSVVNWKRTCYKGKFKCLYNVNLHDFFIVCQLICLLNDIIVVDTNESPETLHILKHC